METTVKKVAETKYPMLAKAQGEVINPIPQQEPIVDVVNPGEAPKPEVKVEEPIVAPKVEAKEVTDEDKLKLINEALGTNYKTLAEARPKAVKSKEDIAAEKEEKRQKSLTWAIESKKVKLEDYEKSIADKAKSPRDIALAIFTKELQEEDSKITPAQAEEQFKDYYMEEDENNSPLGKLRKKEMEKVAANFLKENYGSLDSLENDYEAHQTSEQRQEGYGKLVKTVSSTLPKELKFSVPYTSPDGTTANIEYSYPVEDKDIANAKKEFLTPEMYEALGANVNDVSEKAIASEMSVFIQTRRMNDIIAKVATDHAEKANADLMAKLKNIPATGTAALPGNPESAKPKDVPTYSALKEAQKRMGMG